MAVVVALCGLPVDPSVVEAAGTGAATSPAAGPPAGPPEVLPAGGSWTVTLLTGEVLDVRSDDEGRVAATVREHTGPVRTVREPDGDLYVIPMSVTPLVERVLDPELFNVTGLVRQGYDDASVDAVPLIVQRAPGSDVQATLSTGGGERPLPSIGAVATEVAKADAESTGELLAELSREAGARAGAASGIAKVWLDRQVTTLSAGSAGSAGRSGTSEAAARPTAAGQAEPPGLAGNLTQVGADRAWEAGFTGAGITVAVLDTGVDGTHPDLAGKVVAEQNFGSSPDAVDRIGHGTHVASIVAGSGAASGGARPGVAPGARLLSGKVLNDGGFGFASEVIAGMEWAAPQADVVNMSLSYGFGGDGSDPVSMALDALTAQHDTLFVVAAGNAGPLSRSVGPPGAADRALTVGAVDGQDVLAEFSSRGPLYGSYELKPEVVAPGVDIVAARAAGTTLGAPVDEHHTTASGTSMAAPHVAGAVAVLAQQHPDWTADQLKNGTVGSADPIGADGYDAGAGRIDIGDGVAAEVRTERDVVDVTLTHPRTQPHVETVTWTNTGTEPQTVTLAAELEDREGRPVDEVSVAPAELTLAPGATGTAHLRLDGPALGDGLYSGTVTADPRGPRSPDGDGADQDDLRMPLAVHAAPEMVDLTIEIVPPPGLVAQPEAFASVVNLDDFALSDALVAFQGSFTLQVPVGRYSVLGDISSPDRDERLVAQVGEPDITLTGDTTVSFDGAAAVPFHPTVEGVETAPPMYSSAGLVTIPRLGAGGYGLVTQVYAAHPWPPLRLTPMSADPERFGAFQIFRLQAPHLSATAGGEELKVLEVRGQSVPAGEHTFTAVDVGDGTDLSGAAGRLALVQLPADHRERAMVSQRAAAAGVALLAFLDEQRPGLTVEPLFGPEWAELPVVAAGGTSAAALRAAAATGEPVTVTVTASPYVYDVATPVAGTIDPELVIDRAEQEQMAMLRERFHRDPDGLGATSDRRYHFSTLMNLDSEGPLPHRRTAYVTPGVTWRSMASGPGFLDQLVYSDVGTVQETSRSYDAGSRTTVRWLARPLHPGPVGGPRSGSNCQPEPVRRGADVMHVGLTPFQDEPDRFSCSEPVDATLRLERDGNPIGAVDGYEAEFPVPAEAGTYRLVYEQAADRPYDAHSSTSTWTFRSAAPDGTGDVALPLLVVDYDLPLDTLNRPTGSTATFTVGQVTGSEAQPVESLRVWTSTDDGTTWQRAGVRRDGGGTYRVTLPGVADGTGVSLRVDARDAAGNRIEQTLYDAYVG